MNYLIAFAAGILLGFIIGYLARYKRKVTITPIIDKRGLAEVIDKHRKK
jgi:xanthosine utilization system XapX-like protein